VRGSRTVLSPDRRAWLERSATRIALSLVAFAAALALGVTATTGAEGKVIYTAPPESPTLTFRESVVPRSLSRSTSTPIALNLGGRIGMVDGSRPPAVQQFILDLDKNIAIDSRGLPTCQRGQRDFRFPDLRSRCKGAIVGEGKVGFQIQFPEAPSISTESKLIVVNAGSRKAGETTLYAVANLTQPITSSFVMSIEIKRHPYGNRATIDVPRLANGAGSLTYLSVKLKKRFTRNSEAVDFLTARCPSGTIRLGVKALFEDGTTLQGATLPRCNSRSG
jgi:hypothetical protein